MPKLNIPDAVVRGYLSEQETKFVAGDRVALLRVIGFCARQEVALPKWAAHAYLTTMSRWWSMDVTTLDEAFGVAWPKGKHLAAARKRKRLMFAVLNDVRVRVRQGVAIAPTLFSAVGRKYGLGKTLTEEYYRDAVVAESNAASAATDQLLLPLMSMDAQQRSPTRKISKISGNRSKSRK